MGVLDNMTYTGVGFGTALLLMIIISLVFRSVSNLFEGTVVVGLLEFIKNMIAIVLFVMCVNTFFLKRSGHEDKVFRIQKLY